MFSTFLSISSLLAGYAILFIGNALLTTLVSIRAQSESFHLVEIGLINAAYFLGLYVSAKYSDYFVARAGHSRAYAIFASVGGICALSHPLVVDAYVWMVIRFGTGFCVAGVLMITESWLNAKAAPNTRGQLLSIYMITHYLAAGVGQLLIPFAEPDAFQLFSIAAIGYALSLVPVSLTRTIAPDIPSQQKFKFLEIYRLSPVAMFGALCCGVTSAALYGLAPVYLQGIGLTLDTVSYFMALVIFSGVLLQLPVGRFSDRLDRRKLMIVICLISGLLAMGVVWSASLSTWLFLASATAFGAFSFAVYPVALAHMNDVTPREKLLYAAAGMLTAFSIGAIISPILATWAMGVFGYGALFVFMAITYFIYAIVALWRIQVTPSPKRKKFRRYFRARPRSSKGPISSRKLRDEQDRDLAKMSR